MRCSARFSMIHLLAHATYKTCCCLHISHNHSVKNHKSQHHLLQLHVDVTTNYPRLVSSRDISQQLPPSRPPCATNTRLLVLRRTCCEPLFILLRKSCLGNWPTTMKCARVPVTTRVSLTNPTPRALSERKSRLQFGDLT